MKTLHLEVVNEKDERVELEVLTGRERRVVRALCHDLVEVVDKLDIQDARRKWGFDSLLSHH